MQNDFERDMFVHHRQGMALHLCTCVGESGGWSVSNLGIRSQTVQIGLESLPVPLPRFETGPSLALLAFVDRLYISDYSFTIIVLERTSDLEQCGRCLP